MVLIVLKDLRVSTHWTHFNPEETNKLAGNGPSARHSLTHLHQYVPCNYLKEQSSCSTGFIGMQGSWEAESLSESIIIDQFRLVSLFNGSLFS